MTAFLIFGCIVLFCFGFVLLYGAPYLPTLPSQIETTLKLANLKPGQKVIELGCGDGRVMVAFAKQGVNVVGYELNPILFLICWLRLRPYSDLASVHFGNFWNKSWPAADLIYTFLLTRYMSRLEQALSSYPKRPVRLISYAFELPNLRPAKQKNGLFLYIFD